MPCASPAGRRPRQAGITISAPRDRRLREPGKRPRNAQARSEHEHRQIGRPVQRPEHRARERQRLGRSGLRRRQIEARHRRQQERVRTSIRQAPRGAQRALGQPAHMRSGFLRRGVEADQVVLSGGAILGDVYQVVEQRVQRPDPGEVGVLDRGDRIGRALESGLGREGDQRVDTQRGAARGRGLPPAQVLPRWGRRARPALQRREVALYRSPVLQLWNSTIRSAARSASGASAEYDGSVASAARQPSRISRR